MNPQSATKALSTRLSSDEVRRLELALRMRSWALSRGAPARDCCPGCGRAIAPDDDRLRVGAVTVHRGCVPGSISEPPG